MASPTEQQHFPCWARLTGCFVAVSCLPLAIVLQGGNANAHGVTFWVAAFISARGLGSLMGHKPVFPYWPNQHKEPSGIADDAFKE